MRWEVGGPGWGAARAAHKNLRVLRDDILDHTAPKMGDHAGNWPALGLCPGTADFKEVGGNQIAPREQLQSGR